MNIAKTSARQAIDDVESGRAKELSCAYRYEADFTPGEYKDENGNARWLGTGPLIVRENPANGSPVPPEIIPADTYIRNPVTGLYHKLLANVNELGEITTYCDPEGIQR